MLPHQGRNNSDMFHVKQSYAFRHATPTVTESESTTLSQLPPILVSRLESYVTLIRKWSTAQNLLSSQDVSQLWQRHILDSLQLFNLAPEALRWLDVGTGSGFPAIVIACCLANSLGANVDCVESNRRKSAFLAATARKLTIPMTIRTCRIEDLRPQSVMPVDVVTARAVKAWPELLSIARPYLANGAVGLFPLGKSVLAKQSEVPDGYEVQVIRSVTSPQSVIVRVKLAQNTFPV